MAKHFDEFGQGARMTTPNQSPDTGASAEVWRYEILDPDGWHEEFNRHNPGDAKWVRNVQRYIFAQDSGQREAVAWRWTKHAYLRCDWRLGKPDVDDLRDEAAGRYGPIEYAYSGHPPKPAQVAAGKVVEPPAWLAEFMQKYRLAPTDWDTLAEWFRNTHEERIQLREKVEFLTAKPAQVGEKDAVAWLIEEKPPTGAPRWLSAAKPKRGGYVIDWHTDANQAIRFCRAIDAEMVAAILVDQLENWAITEHVFIGAVVPAREGES